MSYAKGQRVKRIDDEREAEVLAPMNWGKWAVMLDPAAENEIPEGEVWDDLDFEPIDSPQGPTPLQAGDRVSHPTLGEGRIPKTGMAPVTIDGITYGEIIDHVLGTAAVDFDKHEGWKRVALDRLSKVEPEPHPQWEEAWLKVRLPFPNQPTENGWMLASFQTADGDTCSPWVTEDQIVPVASPLEHGEDEKPTALDVALVKNLANELDLVQVEAVTGIAADTIQDLVFAQRDAVRQRFGLSYAEFDDLRAMFGLIGSARPAQVNNIYVKKH